MHTSKFTVFMALKVVVCIGSDSVDNVFSVRLVGFGGRRGASDVGLSQWWCMGNGGMLWGWERMKCSMVVLFSLSGVVTMVRLPRVYWDKGSRLVQEQEIRLRQNPWQ